MRFPNLFSPFRIRSTEFRNRIFSTGHDTYLPEGGLPSPALIAYQAARARGGAGLIIIQVVGVHETARYTGELLMGTSNDCIPSYRELIEPLRALGSKVFVQLFHPGRELLGRPEGVIQPAYAPSFSPSERFRTVPRPMSSRCCRSACVNKSSSRSSVAASSHCKSSRKSASGCSGRAKTLMKRRNTN